MGFASNEYVCMKEEFEVGEHASGDAETEVLCRIRILSAGRLCGEEMSSTLFSCAFDADWIRTRPLGSGDCLCAGERGSEAVLVLAVGSKTLGDGDDVCAGGEVCVGDDIVVDMSGTLYAENMACCDVCVRVYKYI
jgi:hypothetical protein